MNVKEKLDAFSKTENYAEFKKAEECELTKVKEQDNTKVKEPVQPSQPVQPVQPVENVENIVSDSVADPNNPADWKFTETKGDVKYKYEKSPCNRFDIWF
jgi:hypothetical protein